MTRARRGKPPLAASHPQTMISKREAQLLAVQLCDNEMPSDWVRTDIKIVSCDFIESSQRWNIFVRMVVEHGDVIIFDVWVSPSGEDMDLTWSAI